MKTALLTGSYLDGIDPLGSPRFTRLERFIGWHWKLFQKIGFDEIYLADNASPGTMISSLQRNATVLRFQNHLPRGPGENEYPYCWRMLYAAKILIQLEYEKIIFLDSDCFIVSQRMVDHVRSLETGWESFWIPKYEFPSAEFYVLCKDAFPIYEAFTSAPYSSHVGKLMEKALPFTNVNRTFKIDRWGETRIPHDPDMDMYSQCPVDLPLTFTEN